MYDWVEMNQVKNVSEEKTSHPCQIPVEIMKTLIEISTNETEMRCGYVLEWVFLCATFFLWVTLLNLLKQ